MYKFFFNITYDSFHYLFLSFFLVFSYIFCTSLLKKNTVYGTVLPQITLYKKQCSCVYSASLAPPNFKNYVVKQILRNTKLEIEFTKLKYFENYYTPDCFARRYCDFSLSYKAVLFSIGYYCYKIIQTKINEYDIMPICLPN